MRITVVLNKEVSMMKVVFIFGPQAVGKMTIGEELSKKMGVPLLFNHMTLDILTPFLGWSKDTFRISQMIRCEILESIAKNPDSEGIIMTFSFYFDDQADWDIFHRYLSIFESKGIRVSLVELEASLKERLRRNVTENRLAKKPSKRDLRYSKKELLTSNKKHRLNSNLGEINHPNYFRLDVTDLSVEAAVDKIMAKFWRI